MVQASGAGLGIELYLGVLNNDDAGARASLGFLFRLRFGFFGFSLGVGDVFVVLAVHAIDKTDDNEDREGDDEEIDDVLEKIAVGDVGDGVGTEEIGDVEGKGREVETASNKAGDRHDHVVDKGFDDGGEGATNCDTDGEINNAAAIDELAELFHEGTFGDFFDWSRITNHDRTIIT